MTIQLPTLETSCLRLRKLRREDVALYYARLWSQEAVARYMLWQPHKTIEDSAASIEKVLCRYETGESCRFCIALKETDELIGIIDLLRFDEKVKSCSFAYMLGADFWGKGYGTEAVKAVFGFAFDVLGVERITADHFSANPASGAVMKKAGMVWQRKLPRQYEKNGQAFDAEEYSITKHQWNGQKGS